MALAELLASLERDAAREREAALAAARAEAEGIRQAAAERAEARRGAALAPRAAARRAEARRAVAQARHDGMAAALQARAAVLARVLAVARAELATGTAAYQAALSARLPRLGAYLGDGRGVVRCPPDAVAATRAAARAAGLSVQPDPGLRDGVVLASADGAVVVDDTLSARLVRQWPRLAVEVARALETAT